MNTTMPILDFLMEVPPQYSDFVSQSHELLTRGGYKPKVQLKRHGLSVQYNSPNTKGNALQFIVRDNVLHVYVYNILLYEHDGFLEKLPQTVIDEYAFVNNCAMYELT